MILALFAAALLVRVYHLGLPSLCFDELITAVRIHHPFVKTILLLRYQPFPPLHYAILNAWVHVVGNSEWALRFPSAVFSSLTVIVLYKLAVDLFNKQAALLSSVLFIFSPFSINYAQNAKMYALYWFLTAVSFLYFFRYQKSQDQEAYQAYIISSILACYTMYTGFLFLIVQSMLYVLSTERSKALKWFTGQLIIISCCIPWVILFLISKHGFYLRHPGEAFSYLHYFVSSLVFILGSPSGSLAKITSFIYIFLVSYLFMNTWSDYKQKKLSALETTRSLWLAGWVLIPVVIYFIFDFIFIRANLYPRYLGFVQVPMIILVSVQICRFDGWKKIVLAAFMLALAVGNTVIYFKDNLRDPQEDWRAEAKQLNQEVRPDDLVLALFDLRLFAYYYSPQRGHVLSVALKDCSTPKLMAQGLLNDQVHSIFVLYKREPVPDIQLDGFLLDYQIRNGSTGFLHFRHMNT